MDALDFNIIMSPRDVWNGFLSGDDDQVVVRQLGHPRVGEGEELQFALEGCFGIARIERDALDDGGTIERVLDDGQTAQGDAFLPTRG